MADFINFYKFDGSVPTSSSELQNELISKTCLQLQHPGWIQATLGEIEVESTENRVPPFLLDNSSDFSYFSTSNEFSCGSVLSGIRLADEAEFGLSVDMQFLHLFWILDASMCKSAAVSLDQILDSAITELDNPNSQICEYANSETPSTRDSLKYSDNPIELCYSGEGDSTDYLLHALNSAHGIIGDIKCGQYILVNSVEHVPVSAINSPS